MKRATCFLILIAIAMSSFAQSNPTNFYEYVHWYTDPATFVPSEEGGPYAKSDKQLQRMCQIWEERLYPTGDAAVAAAAYQDYYDEFLAQPLPSVEATWIPLGPLGVNNNLWAGRMHRITLDPRYGTDDGNGVNWTIYGCHAHSGLWRSTTQSIDWHPLNTDLQLPFASAADLAINPLNPDQLFLATGMPDEQLPKRVTQSLFAINPIYTTGVFRSLDAGQTWHPINSGFLDEFGTPGTIRRMLIHPTDPNILFAATSKGIFKTENALASDPIWELVLIWSTDLGDYDDRNFRGMAFHPTDPDVLYVSGLDIYQIEVSTGNTTPLTGSNTTLDWTNVPDPLFTLDQINIATTPAAPDRVYAYVLGVLQDGCPNEDIESAYIYVLENGLWHLVEQYQPVCGGGISALFTALSPAWMPIAVHPTNPDQIVFGHVKLQGYKDPDITTETLLTDPVGQNFGSLSQYGGSTHHADVHDIVFEPVTPFISDPRILEANDGGMAIKQWNSSTWSNTMGWSREVSGLNTHTIWSFDDSDRDPRIQVAAMQDNGTNYINPHEPSYINWVEIEGGDGYSAQVDDLNQIVYYRGNTDIFTNTFDINQVEDEGIGEPCCVGGTNCNYSLSEHPSPLDQPGSPCKADMAQTFKVREHPTENRVYVAMSEIYQRLKPQPDAQTINSDPVDLWRLESDQKHDVPWKRDRMIVEFEIAEGDPNYIYTVARGFLDNGEGSGNTTGHLFVSESGFGISSDPSTPVFEDRTGNLPDYGSPNSGIAPLITGIAVSPIEPDLLWVCVTGYEDDTKVLVSTDAGLTWGDADPNNTLYNLPCNAIVHQNGTVDRLFVGTDAGVFMKEEGATDWVRYGNIPNVRVTELKINRCSGKLKAATFGRGMWEADLPPAHPLTYDVIDNTQSWTGEHFVKRDVRVEDGGHLIISGTVHMPADGRIVVMPGGRLQIQGGHITNTCDAMWHGVEVVGEIDQPQNTTIQGYCTISSGSILENARVAITAGMTDQSTGEYVPNAAGGIIKVTSSTFLNCRNGVLFASHWGYDWDSQSWIKDSEFRISDLLNDQVASVGAMVKMTGIDGVLIQGNLAINEAPYLYPTKGRGVGIISQSSTWIANNYCDSPVAGDDDCQQGIWIQNRFENLYLGVRAFSSKYVSPFVVDNALFTNCLGGVNMQGIYGAAIVRSEFNIPDNQEISPYATYGLFAHGCAGWEIEENIFTNIGTAPTFENVGIGINSSKGNNAVYNNDFLGLSVASMVMGKNTSPIDFEIGLQVLCNEYGQNGDDNFYDIAMTGLAPLFPTMSATQGSFGLNTEDPAGNLFSYNPSPGTYDFYIEQQANVITYNHHDVSGGSNVAPLDIAGQQFLNLEEYEENDFNSNSCPSDINVGIDHDSDHDVEKMLGLDDLLEMEWDIYRDQVDQGSTQNLQAFVNDPQHSSLEVRNELIAAAPYVSDQIWSASFNRVPSMDSWHLAMALLENSPLKGTTIRLMQQSNLEPFYQALVNGGQGGGISSMSILESEISSFTLDRETSLGNYVRSFLTDSTTNATEPELLGFLDVVDNEHHLNILAGYYATTDNYSALQNILNNCGTNSLHSDLCLLYGLMSSAYQSQAPFSGLDQTTINDLVLIADDEDNPACSLARSILVEGGHSEFPATFIFPGGVLRSFQESGGTRNSGIESRLSIYPNPSNGIAYATYEVDASVVNARAELWTTDGRLIQSWNSLNGNGILEIDQPHLSPGIYIMILYWDGIAVENTNFSVVK